MSLVATDTWRPRAPMPAQTPRSRPPRPRLRKLQIALGSLWLLDGLLRCQPFMFQRSLVTQVIAPNAAGQPTIVAQPILWVAHAIEPRVAVFNALAASLQILIGLGLIYRRTVRAALLASFAWAIGVWWFGEGLGMLLAGSASPLTGAPGAVLLYALIGAVLWPCEQDGRARREAGLLGGHGARIMWAALWLLQAGLWLSPANRGPQATRDAIAAAPSGAGWLSSIQHTAARAATSNGEAIAIVLAIASAAIAIAVLLDWHPLPFLALSCVLAMAYWVLGQGLGGTLTGSAPDPNSGPLLLLLAATMRFALTPSTSRSRPTRTPPSYTINGRSYKPIVLH